MHNRSANLSQEVRIAVGRGVIGADVTIPDNCRGAVIFAHGSGSSRRSTRNRFVANRLVTASFATVLADLLTPEEAAIDEVTAQHRFDIGLLANRVADVLRWTQSQEALRALPAGLFGASTGAAAALVAAAQPGSRVGAVVSRGGRPDLAGQWLSLVRAPTLFIVGGHDPQVLQLNRKALALLKCEARLDVVPGATHLFEEPGTLESATTLARDWFLEHLAVKPPVDL
jgi:putative phosphoribosyl transferase